MKVTLDVENLQGAVVTAVLVLALISGFSVMSLWKQLWRVLIHQLLQLQDHDHNKKDA